MYDGQITRENKDSTRFGFLGAQTVSLSIEI
jgi:hypothetical protein